MIEVPLDDADLIYGNWVYVVSQDMIVMKESYNIDRFVKTVKLVRTW